MWKINLYSTIGAILRSQWRRRRKILQTVSAASANELRDLLQLLNGHKLTDINVADLRQHFGLVSQEPILFDRTIAENIRYGANYRDDVTMEEIIDAARQANIHEFIASLPLVRLEGLTESDNHISFDQL